MVDVAERRAARIRGFIPWEIWLPLLAMLALAAFMGPYGPSIANGCIYGPTDPHWFNVCISNLR